MDNIFSRFDIERLFNKSYRRGAKLVSKFAKIFLGNRYLISLTEIYNITGAIGESISKTEDILVEKIIGSEDRSFDFAEGFLPTKKHLENRWISVYKLMLKGSLEEPITVIDFGGYYFVRDGHHRVSVAKLCNREFIRAKISKLDVPYRLPNILTRRKMKHLKRLVEFQKKTNFYSIVKGAMFDISRIGSWDILERELLLWSPSWYERFKEYLMVEGREEQLNTWYYKMYSHINSVLNKRSLHYLFPGWGVTDIIMEMIKLWNTYPDSDNISIEEVYDNLVKKNIQKRFYIAPYHFIFGKLNSLRRTSDDERSIFYIRSNINQICPDFSLPNDLSKRYWRNLYREVFSTHYQNMRKELKRSPFQHELIKNWYQKIWLPRTEYINN